MLCYPFVFYLNLTYENIQKDLTNHYTDFCLKQFPESGNLIYYTNLLS